MKKFFTKEVKIGITVILSICVLYWGIEFLKGINLFKPANFYYAKFERVNGLNIAAPITINGFSVGQVREIEYNYQTNDIYVLLSLNKDLKIPTNSKIIMANELLGAASLVLEMSNEKTYYEVGSEIPSEISGGLMDKVASDMLPAIANMMPKIDSILTNINVIVSNPALNNSVSRLDEISANLAETTKAFSMISNHSLPVVVNNVEGITTNLKGASENVYALTQKANEMPIEQTIANLNATVSNLKVLSDKMTNNESTLGLLMTDKRLYNDLDKAVSSLDSLLTDLKANPKRYVTFKVF